MKGKCGEVSCRERGRPRLRWEDLESQEAIIIPNVRKWIAVALSKAPGGGQGPYRTDKGHRINVI